MFESSLIRKGISCREDLVEYFESIMGVPEETEEYCKLEDRISLPNGWRIMNESNRTYYVHLESLTVQLSPPKSGIVPGLHRQLCQFLVL